MDHSQAFAHATRWLRVRDERKRQAEHTQSQLKARPVARVSQQEYLNNMLAIVSLARQRGISVIVIAAPYRDHASEAPEADLMLQYRVALGSIMRQHGVPFLEIRELTEEAYPANEGWFGERIHPNHMGHRLIASELLKLIASKRMLGEVNIPTVIP